MSDGAITKKINKTNKKTLNDNLYEPTNRRLYLSPLSNLLLLN